MIRQCDCPRWRAPRRRFGYDGLSMLAEYNGSNALQRRYVFAPGLDQPIVWYEGSSVDSTTRRFVSADERGSIVSVTDSSGNLIGTDAHDEYGIPVHGRVPLEAQARGRQGLHCPNRRSGADRPLTAK